MTQKFPTRRILDAFPTVVYVYDQFVENAIFATPERALTRYDFWCCSLGETSLFPSFHFTVNTALINYDVYSQFYTPIAGC